MPRADTEVSRPSAPRLVDPSCPLEGAIDPASVAELAERRAQSAVGRERIAALQCSAMALSDLGNWREAAARFLQAHDMAVDDAGWRARIGAQRGHALAAAGRTPEALAAFAGAIRDALSVGDRAAAGEIAADKSIVEVSTGNMAAAAATLMSARSESPDEPRVWLLSATLARRTDQLPTAQEFIEQAVELDPLNPASGLEAGVIAALSGRYGAARASFNSVLALPNAGDSADTARIYIEQLDEMEAASK